MTDRSNQFIREEVRQSYAQKAGQPASDCGCAPSCCPDTPEVDLSAYSHKLGYSAEEVKQVPEGANLGLGCGNPRAIANLQKGETVLDLGCGAGFDCFLAAQAVGRDGKVIGVDMTPEMLVRARENAGKGDFSNVEFRLGEIEHLPVEDGSVDVIISNCVVNLSPEKPQVFREALRALKPGGRLAIADIVATADLPETVKQEIRLYAACIAGASSIDQTKAWLSEAGFAEIRITPKEISREIIREWLPDAGIEKYLTSAYIEAVKPALP